MSEPAPSPKASFAFLPPILRLAMRDLRGGLAGLRIFLACIALGVATIVGVNSLARSLEDGLSRDGRAILGGDASFSLIHREMAPEERAYLGAQAALSTVGSMRAMARAGDGRRDADRNQGGRCGLAERRARRIFAPQWTRMTRWRKRTASMARRSRSAARAARLSRSATASRSATSRSKSARRSSPNPTGSARASALAPRALISEDALRATGLIQPGSLVRWTTRVAARRRRRAAERWRRQGLRRRREQSLSRSRLGGARPRQCLAELLQAISIASPNSSR